ncbi:uncharacterized protein [Porites lutea]|uniref:uncharacterized protein n=1 Tax=Porites lutea TaxID=51062 RepID=UPI003CC5EA81
MSLWRKILLIYMLAHQIPNTLNGTSVEPSSKPTRTPAATSVRTRTAALSLSSNLTATPTATATLSLSSNLTAPPTATAALSLSSNLTATPTATETPTETPTPIRKPAPIPKATPKPKPKLRCFLCFSENSWEHCDKTSRVIDCKPGFDEACLKMTQNEWEKKNGTKTGKVLTRYMKYCAKSEQCSDTQCKEMGWQCKVDCCTEDLCNSNAAVLTTSSHHHYIVTLILTAVVGLAAVP